MQTEGITEQTATETAPQRLVTTEFTLSWLVNFAQFLIFYLLITTMALYAVERFAASDAESGLAASSFVIGATVARFFTGYVVDRFGRRRLMLISLIGVVVACAGYLLDTSLLVLVLVRVLHGISYAVANTAMMTIAQSAIPAERRAEGTGYLALGTTLATAVGPAVGLFVVGQYGYTVLFAASLATAVLGLVLGLVVHQHPTEKAAAAALKQRVHPRFSLRSILAPRVVPVGLFMLLIGVAYSGVLTFLMSSSSERGLSSGASFFFLAYAATMLVMRFVLGRIQDNHGDAVVIYLGVVSFAVALGLLAVASEDWHVVLAGGLAGLGYGTLMPACQAISVRLVSPLQLGTGLSTMFLLMDIGLGLGPIVLGSLLSLTGFSMMYALLGGIVVVAGIFYAAVVRRVSTPAAARSTRP
ncbi:MAG: MFS transporter [Micrococcaceae bacterium]